MWRGAITGLVVASACALPAGAAAEPVSFAHGTIDNQFTTTQPGTPTGATYTGTYHAANDPSSDPPYMRKMTFYPPAGMRSDTSVPDQCTATDLQLQVQGPSACPEGSRLGGGTGRAKVMGSEATVEIVRFNNTNEQILLARSPILASVSRGRIAPDGSVTFASPTCFPSLVTCPVDNALQIGSEVSSPPYTRDGRSYSTTPAKCPKAGYWQSTVRFWWADGSEDTVVTKQACTRPAAKAKKKRSRSRSGAR
jgi:hypothetical protein